MAQTIIRINAQLQWGFVKDAATGRWVGICDPLKLTVEGETYNELLETINDALNGLLLDLLNDGQLDSFLKDHGWSTPIPVPLRAQNNTSISFDVPFEVIKRAKENGHPRAVN